MLVKRSTILILTALLMLSSCSSSTVYNTDPPGAKIFINNSLVGTTPYQYSDNKIVNTTLYIRMTKEGYEDLYKVVSRDDHINTLRLVTGIFTIVPLLWVKDYAPAYTWEMRPVK